jgi:acyl-CoA synthetase (AMP-forming)/AMP-acid ligase II
VILSGSRWPDWLDSIPVVRECRKVQVQDGTDSVDLAPHSDDQTIALVQFSSGSTSAPKGVRLSHGNLVANCRAIAAAYGLHKDGHGLSWLPLHHDMGLVGHVLSPMWVGGRSTLMSPLRFLQRPLSWLHLVSRERATITSAPNFACEICVRAAEADGCGDMDLSSLETLVCGGEPILPTTVRRFVAAFERHGFAASAFAPSYGLAEATLLVTSGKTKSGPVFAPSTDPTVGEVTDVGVPALNVSVAILDADGRLQPDDTIGEIAVGGDGIGVGLEDAPATPRVDSIRTGDLGFLRGGHLFVTGRLKEIIIIRGQNYYPPAIEEAAMNAGAEVVPGGIAAIGLELGGTEELFVLFEIRRGTRLGAEAVEGLERQVGENIARQVGVVPECVVAVGHGTLPRTPSGKVRRRSVVRWIEAGGVRDKAGIRAVLTRSSDAMD